MDQILMRRMRNQLIINAVDAFLTTGCRRVCSTNPEYNGYFTCSDYIVYSYLPCNKCVIFGEIRKESHKDHPNRNIR